MVSRFIGQVLAVLVLVLITTACEIRTWVDIDLSSGNGGTVSIQFGFDEELREVIEGFGGGDPLGGIEEQVEEEGWTVAEFNEGEVSGITATRQFSSLEQMQETLESAGPEEVGAMLQSISITEIDDSISFEATVGSPLDDDLGGELGGGLNPGAVDLLTVDGRVTVTFPGQVTSHNGTLQGNTVTWTFDEDTEGLIEMNAVGRKGGGIDPVVIVAIGLTIVVGVVAWYSKARRTGKSPLPEEPVIAIEPNPGDG
jgi:hypothetical protein